MGVKISEWRLKMTENVHSTLGKLNSAMDKSEGKLNGLSNKLNSPKFNSLAAELPQTGRALDLITNKYAMAGAGIAAVGAISIKAGQEALIYEEAMAKINATAQLAPPALDALKTQLIEIGEESGGNFMRIPDAFEKINSSINNVNESLELTKLAAKGAKAGFTDIDIVGAALAQSKSALGEKAEASDILNTMFAAKKAGNAEFKDIANYLPGLMASGDAMGVNYKDIAGMFSFFTGKVSASESATLLQNAMSLLGKTDIQQSLATQGLRLFDKNGNTRDLNTFFLEMKAKLDRFTPEAKSKWLDAMGIKDMQAKTALSFMVSDAEKLNSMMLEVRNSTGELNKALEMTENKTRNWREIGDEIKAGMIGLGDFLLPIVDKLISGAKAWKDSWTYVGGSKETESVDKLGIYNKLAKNFAQQKVMTEFPELKQSGERIFRDDGAHLGGKYKERFDYWKNWDMAKLTGTYFGGDYDKFIASQKAKLAPPPPPEKKIGFTAPDKPTRKNIKEGIENVSQGGQRVINIQFGKLNENIIIQPQTLKEGTTEVVQMTEEMLVRIIEGTEVSVANE